MTGDSRREVMVSAFAAFVVRVVGAGAAYAMTVIIVRSIGADEAGYFYLGMSLVAMLATVGNLGLEYAVLRFVGAEAAAGHWSEVRALVRAASRRAARALFGLALAAGAVSASLALLKMIGSDAAGVFVVVAPAIVLLGLALVTAYALQGVRRTTLSVVVFSVSTPLLMVLGNVLLAVTSAREMALLYLVATGTTFGVARLLFRATVPADRSAPELAKTHELFSIGRVFWTGIIANQLLISNGHLPAGLFLRPHDVTIFAVAQRTVTLISFVLVAVNFVVAPRYAAMHAARDVAGIRRLGLFSAALSTLFSLPLVAIVCIFPTQIMNVFEPGLGGGAVLVILAIGQLLTAMCGTFGVLLDMTGHERFHRRVIIGTTAAAVVMLVVFTPLLGVVGAALAMSIGLSAQNIIQGIRVLQLYGRP